MASVGEAGEVEGVGAERAGQAVSSPAAGEGAGEGAAFTAAAEVELDGGSHLGMLEISLSVLSRFPTGACAPAPGASGVGCPAA